MFKNVFFNGQGSGYVSYFDWDSYSMISTRIPQFEKKTRYGPTDGQTLIQRCVDASKNTQKLKIFQLTYR